MKSATRRAPTATGVDARALIQAARLYGLTARGVAADLDDIEHLPPGSILHWEFTHFVVLEHLGKRASTSWTPPWDAGEVAMETLRRAYTGVAIIVEPGDQFPEIRAQEQGHVALPPPPAQSIPHAHAGARGVRAAPAAGTGAPRADRAVSDQVVPQNDRNLLMVIGASMAAIVGYYLLSSLMRAHLLLQLRTQLDVPLTRNFVEHLVALPYSFFLGRSAGDLMMRLQSNTVVRETLTSGALSALLDGSLSGLYLIVLAVLSPPLAALVLGLGLLQVTVLLLSWRPSRRLMSESLQVQAKTQSYTYELLAGIETLKASGAEQRAAEHWEKLFVDQINVELVRGRLSASVQAAMSTFQVASPLAILVLGGVQVLDGTMQLGTMLAAAALAAGFLQPLTNMVSVGLSLQLLRSYMERINDVLDMPREQKGSRYYPLRA